MASWLKSNRFMVMLLATTIGITVLFTPAESLVYEMCSDIATIRTAEGYIVNENYPLSYTSNRHCTVNVVAQRNKLLLLTILKLDLARDRQNCTDWISIKDVEFSPPLVLLDMVCTMNYFPVKVSSSSNKLEISFYSSHVGFGFQIQYKALTPVMPTFEICGSSEVQCPGGYVVSPRFPNDYPNNLKCIMVLKASKSHHQFKLSFNTLYLESNKYCSLDSLGIIYGTQESPNKRKYCGKPGEDTTDVITNSSRVEIVFLTDHSAQKKGFNVTFEEIPLEDLTTPIPLLETTARADTETASKIVVMKNESSTKLTKNVHLTNQMTSSSFTSQHPGIILSTATMPSKATSVASNSQATTYNFLWQSSPKTHAEQDDGILYYLIGGVIGGIVILATVIAVVVLLCRRHTGKHSLKTEQEVQYKNAAFEDDENIYQEVKDCACDDGYEYCTPEAPSSDNTVVQEPEKYYTAQAENDYDYVRVQFENHNKQTTYHEQESVDWYENGLYILEDVTDEEMKRTSTTSLSQAGLPSDETNDSVHLNIASFPQADHERNFGAVSCRPQLETEWTDNSIYDSSDPNS